MSASSNTIDCALSSHPQRDTLFTLAGPHLAWHSPCRIEISMHLVFCSVRHVFRFNFSRAALWRALGRGGRRGKRAGREYRSSIVLVQCQVNRVVAVRC